MYIKVYLRILLFCNTIGTTTWLINCTLMNKEELEKQNTELMNVTPSDISINSMMLLVKYTYIESSLYMYILLITS